MAIKWNEKYSVHNELIDSEHKELFDIAEQAEGLINRQVSSDEIKALIAKLFEYMKEHFSDEEHYMESIGYPLLPKHKELHKAIISQMIDLIKDIKYDFKQKLVIMLEKWLVEHILENDTLIEKYRVEHADEIQAYIASNKNSSLNFSHIYTCKCEREFRMLNVVHKKIQAGRTFRCKKCGSPMVFVRNEEMKPPGSDGGKNGGWKGNW